MVGPSGLEPPTSRLSGVRSNQLSYGPTGRASMGGSAGKGQVTHSRTQSDGEPLRQRRKSRGGAGPASRLQLHAPEERLRIAHGLENPEV